MRKLKRTIQTLVHKFRYRWDGNYRAECILIELSYGLTKERPKWEVRITQ